MFNIVLLHGSEVKKPDTTKAEAIKLAWMYMSLPVGIFFMISINIELIFRNILSNFTKLELPNDTDQQKLEAQ